MGTGATLEEDPVGATAALVQAVQVLLPLSYDVTEEALASSRET